MRISTAYQYESYIRDIGLAQERYATAQKQVSTGKRFTLASEDWLGTAQSLSYRNVQDTVTQYRKNVQDAKTDLNLASNAFDEAAGLVNQAYSLSVQAANGVLDQSGRAAMSAQISSIQQRLVALGNSRGSHNQFIFGGQKDNAEPFSVSSSGIVFNGDNNAVTVETAPGQTMNKNFAAESVFSDAYNALASFKNNLDGGNTGAISGVDIGALQTATTNFRQVQGQAGMRVQSLEQIDASHVKRLDDLTQGISDVEDVDMTQAIVNLQLSQTTYQAALTAAGKGFNLSLLDFING